MPVTATGVYGVVWPQLIGKMPTVVNANRANVAQAVPPHNVMSKMLTYCCRAWVSVITATPVTNTYAGVTGGSAIASPTNIIFPGAGAAGAQLIAAMQWLGPSAPIIANALTMDIAIATQAQALYVSGPCPGGGAGSGVILPNNTVPLLSTAGLFVAALVTNFQSEGLFSINDLKVAPTPQIIRLIGSLGGVYATMYASMTSGPIAYAGPVSPVPLSVPVVPGKIV